MAVTSPRSTSDSQSLSSTSSASDLLSILSCCENTTECHHDMNPWSDSDPELQFFSKAALESLQEHVTQGMKSLLHVHDVLHKELTNRKLESRFKISAASKSQGRAGELIFSTDDFEPLARLLDVREDYLEVIGADPSGDERDVIAKMCLAWISRAQETNRSSRTRRPASVKSRSLDEIPVVIDVEDVDCGSILSQDFEDLEAEMEVFS